MHQLLLLGPGRPLLLESVESLKYRTEVGKDDACEEYEPD